MGNMTIDELLEEGKQFRTKFGHVPTTRSGGVIAVGHPTFNARSEYQIWKQKVIRYLSIKYPGDRCIQDFEKAAQDFETHLPSLGYFDVLIGILESCKLFPDRVQQVEPYHKDSHTPNISIHNQLSQNQIQQQSIDITIVIEAIANELKGSQLKELREVAVKEPDPVKAKSKILEKLKSFGGDVLSNVLANLITNPAIWSKLI